MYRNIDVMTEMRKLTDSKPVHAVAGAGVLASQTLKDLPGRLIRWGADNPVTSLPARATGYVRTARTNATGAVQNARTNATGAVQNARTKAAGGYDTLASHGKKALNGQSNAAQSKSTTAAQSKTAVNGRAKGKTTSRTTTSH
jgi:hypothetical protein